MCIFQADGMGRGAGGGGAGAGEDLSSLVGPRGAATVVGGGMQGQGRGRLGGGTWGCGRGDQACLGSVFQFLPAMSSEVRQVT